MSRAGMDRETGRLLTGWEHCAQSIAVILTTRIGWRVMRRAFGSRVHELQDRNPDPATLLQVFSAIAEALRTWEPGFRLARVTPVSITSDGLGAFELGGTFYPRGHLGDYSITEQQTARIGGTGAGFRVISTGSPS
jgi:uncharacterized protein